MFLSVDSLIDIYKTFISNFNMGLRDKETFIIYLNDDDRQVNAYVRVLELNSGFIKFQTGSNIITIPISRLVKMKEGGQ